MEEVLVTKGKNGLATITLNRPKALNSLNDVMLKKVHEALTAWKDDDDVQVILFDAAGDRAFCAGGDIKTLYAAKDSDAKKQEAIAFFDLEYETDQFIDDYPKPIIANLDGIVMGGGVGLTYGADYKIVTEKTKWAMPEMNIGFFPDVGAAYFLNKAPGYTGRYAALTSKTFGAADVLYMEAAEYHIQTEQLVGVLEKLKEVDWHADDVRKKVESLLSEHASAPKEYGNLERLQPAIDKHFQFNTVEEIIQSLETESSDCAVGAREDLLQKSPVSLKVTLEQLIKGEGKSFAECLATDLIIASRFMEHDDFFEGVRSVLIDKDRNPNYKYKTLDQVSDELVASFFEK